MAWMAMVFRAKWGIFAFNVSWQSQLDPKPNNNDDDDDDEEEEEEDDEDEDEDDDDDDDEMHFIPESHFTILPLQ